MTSRVGQVWETYDGQIWLITRSTRRGWRMSHDYLILYSKYVKNLGRLECVSEILREPPWENSNMRRIA